MNVVDKFIKKEKMAGHLIVQPRMGFSSISKMQEGLRAVKSASASTMGTITLDSYTRLNNHNAISKALGKNEELNGFPLVYYGANITKNMLGCISDDDFPVQVRHGTALPFEIFKVMINADIVATEGGPVSYCFPYSRIPLKKSIEEWSKSVELFAEGKNHIETFGGCMLGQLCPPSLLITMAILEGLFFKKHGIKSISFGFTQGTNLIQDRASLFVLKRLINEYFKDCNTHVVLYTFMGLFPKTITGAFKLIKDSARLAKISGIERLIVKTPSEAKEIPTIKENIDSLNLAFFESQNVAEDKIVENNVLGHVNSIFEEANYLIEMVLDLHSDLDKGIEIAFANGYLDIPYCLHPDNNNKALCYIDELGDLRWANLGKIPLGHIVKNKNNKENVSSGELLEMLSYMQNKYDNLSE